MIAITEEDRKRIHTKNQASPGTLYTLGSKVYEGTDDGRLLETTKTYKLEQDQDKMSKYKVNDYEQVGKTIYAGSMDHKDNWLVKRVIEDKEIAVFYANISNNPGVGTYSSAWNRRKSLRYSAFERVTIQ